MINKTISIKHLIKFYHRTNTENVMFSYKKIQARILNFAKQLNTTGYDVAYTSYDRIRFMYD